MKRLLDVEEMHRLFENTSNSVSDSISNSFVRQNLSSSVESLRVIDENVSCRASSHSDSEIHEELEGEEL